MQKFIVLAALMALAWYGARILANMSRLRTARVDARKAKQDLPAKRLRLDEKTGLYVPSDE